MSDLKVLVFEDKLPDFNNALFLKRLARWIENQEFISLEHVVFTSLIDSGFIIYKAQLFVT